jgi:type II secretory pathway component GspD/PulD (secretin)
MKETTIILVLSGLLVCTTARTQETTTPVEPSTTIAIDAATEPTTIPESPAVEVEVEPVASIPAATEPGAEAASATDADAVIPLIVMDEVPLTDAIKNLARQANLNYMLDPKITFGQPGPDGRAAQQPLISIRWETVTAHQALAALLNNYNLQIVEDPKTHIARITTKDPAAPEPLETRIIQLQYASPTNVLTGVQALFVDPRSKVVGDIRTSQLVVLATEKEHAAVAEMVARLDKAEQQVLIEAKLLETSMNPSSVKGLNWSGTLRQQNINVGNNLQENIPTEAVNNTLSQTLPKLLIDTARGFNPATAFLDADGVNAVFSFFNQDSEAKVLSSPRTVTLNNEPATLAVTRAVPIINVSAGTQNTAGGSQITYTNLGVVLTVTPRISANNFVNLSVIPEVSRVFATITRNVGGAPFEADVYDFRKMETRVMIPSGNTLVLGGLVQDDLRHDTTKVPIMGDIPLLGKAFRSSSKTRQQSNLLVFITPTIVQDSDYQPTQTDFLKHSLPTADEMEGEWTSWNTTKPYDWSKLRGPEPQFID